MKKYFRIGYQHIMEDHGTNDVIITGSLGNDFELKVIHDKPAEINHLGGYQKEAISKSQFMNELRTVLIMAETKAIQLHDPATFEELQKSES